MHLEQLKFEKYREGWINNLLKLWVYEKSFMRTGEWKIMWQKIISVIDTTFAVAKRKSEKKFRLSFCNCKSCVYNCDDLLSYKESAISQTSSLNFRHLSGPLLTFQHNSIQMYAFIIIPIFMNIQNKGTPESSEQFFCKCTM